MGHLQGQYKPRTPLRGQVPFPHFGWVAAPPTDSRRPAGPWAGGYTPEVGRAAPAASPSAGLTGPGIGAGPRRAFHSMTRQYRAGAVRKVMSWTAIPPT